MSTATMTDLRIHQVPQQTYLYHACRVTHETIAEAVAETMVTLLDLTSSRQVAATGNLLLVYRGNSSDEDDSFDLWVGLPVLQGTRAIKGFEVTILPALNCAASVHVGASRDIGETYGGLIEHIRAAGFEPTPEIREEYLHWEGRQSDRDITWVQVGVREA